MNVFEELQKVFHRDNIIGGWKESSAAAGQEIYYIIVKRDPICTLYYVKYYVYDSIVDTKIEWILDQQVGHSSIKIDTTTTIQQVYVCEFGSNLTEDIV